MANIKEYLSSQFPTFKIKNISNKSTTNSFGKYKNTLIICEKNNTTRNIFSSRGPDADVIIYKPPEYVAFNRMDFEDAKKTIMAMVSGKLIEQGCSRCSKKRNGNTSCHVCGSIYCPECTLSLANECSDTDGLKMTIKCPICGLNGLELKGRVV